MGQDYSLRTVKEMLLTAHQILCECADMSRYQDREATDLHVEKLYQEVARHIHSEAAGEETPYYVTNLEATCRHLWKLRKPNLIKEIKLVDIQRLALFADFLCQVEGDIDAPDDPLRKVWAEERGTPDYFDEPCDGFGQSPEDAAVHQETAQDLGEVIEWLKDQGKHGPEMSCAIGYLAYLHTEDVNRDERMADLCTHIGTTNHKYVSRILHLARTKMSLFLKARGYDLAAAQASMEARAKASENMTEMSDEALRNAYEKPNDEDDPERQPRTLAASLNDYPPENREAIVKTYIEANSSFTPKERICQGRLHCTPWQCPCKSFEHVGAAQARQ